MRPESSSVSTLLCLYLHLEIFAFFSTSLQNNRYNWNGKCQTNTKDDSIHHVWNFPWSICLRVGFWGQCMWFGFLESRLIRSNNQSSANSVGSGNMSHCRTSVFKWSSWSQLHCSQTHTIKLLDSRIEHLREPNQCHAQHRFYYKNCFPINGLPRAIWNMRNISKDSKTIRFHNSRAGETIQSQSSVRRDDFRFCWTVRNSSLFLAHPTYWNKCMTSQNAQCSTWRKFWILKISCKIGVLKQSRSVLFGSITYMTIVFFHMYDEYMKSIDSGVRHKLWSIL